MNIEDIKVGEWYNVPFKVKEIKSGDIHLINGGIKAVCQPSELSVIGEASMPQYVRVDASNDIDLRSSKDSPLALSNDDIKEFTEWLRQKAESAPKYDPCRKFRKGDRVSPCFWHDRPPVASVYCGNNKFVPKDGVYEVDDDERESFVIIKYHGKSVFVQACHLELVTPVEELEISRVFNDSKTGMWVVVKDNFTYACFPYRKKEGHKIANNEAEAKEAAEAERDRLNAEHRKEQA